VSLGRGLCEELITRPEEAYRPGGVVVGGLGNPWRKGALPTGGGGGGCRAQNKQNLLFNAWKCRL